jgi:hypothetical protein
MDDTGQDTGGMAGAPARGSASASGGAAGQGSAGAQPAGAGGGLQPSAGGAIAAGGAAGAGSTAGASGASGAAGASGGSGSATSAGGAGAGGGGAGGGAGGAAGGGGAGPGDPISYAGKLQGLFIDSPCATNTPTPLAMGATCLHPTSMQRIEQSVTFGGESGKTYQVELRIRGIWEPTKATGGQRPYPNIPFTIGGTVDGSGSSDPIAYQQYSIQVSNPNQTYWLNDHQYLAHDIKKQDYKATIPIAAGATVKVIMNDGNERQIANWTKDYFTDVPPYDKAPSLGQSLRLDVVSVTAK